MGKAPHSNHPLSDVPSKVVMPSTETPLTPPELLMKVDEEDRKGFPRVQMMGVENHLEGVRLQIKSRGLDDLEGNRETARVYKVMNIVRRMRSQQRRRKGQKRTMERYLGRCVGMASA